MVTTCYVVLSILSVLVGSMELVEDCAFSHDKRTYLCTGITERFPPSFYGNYHLKCKDCHIETFGYDTFTGANNLISFNASDSGIHQITTRAFSNLASLQYLHLQDNQISTIGAEAFYGLHKMDELYLDRNELIKLIPRFLAGFQSVSVSLSENKINEIPSEVFEGILGILALNISHNKISTLYEDSFKYLNGLQILDLQHNKICYIPLGIFKYIQTLQELNFSGNKLNVFATGTFSALPMLAYLNLGLNDIGEFDPDILLPLDSLSTLDISRNELYYLDANRIHACVPTLRDLKLSDNSWYCGLLNQMAQYLKSVDIHVSENIYGRYDVTNVNGIACSTEIVDDRIPFDKFYEDVKTLTNRTVKYCAP